MSQDYIVTDIGLLIVKELSIAETEMPGLMALRDGGAQKPLQGARIAGCLHDCPDRCSD